LALISEQKMDEKSDSIGSKWDDCLARLVVNSGVGIICGGVASIMLFRNRMSPVALSVGFGTGMAYESCRSNFSPLGNLNLKIVEKQK